MKKNKWIVIGCNLVGVVCFGIVSYGHFYRERIELGLLFAVLSIAQLVLAFTNYNISKKNKWTLVPEVRKATSCRDPEIRVTFKGYGNF